MKVKEQDIPAENGEHAVHFYEHESGFAQAAARYLIDAARVGAVTLVIASAEHRPALESELDRSGFNRADGERDGALIWLDAAEALAGFMRGGRIDPGAFRRLVGSAIRQAGETGRPVWACGEMAGLLWEDGDVLGAIELEELWNELGRELQFSLLCCYRSDLERRAEHPEAPDQLGRLHSCLWPQPARGANDPQAAGAAEVSARFPAEPDAPRAARRFVTEALANWGHARSLSEDAELVVSELATNAVCHAASPFSVVVRARESGVRLSVRDENPVEPTLRDPDPASVSGRGLRLVAAIATAWGVDPAPDGKAVWADLGA